MSTELDQAVAEITGATQAIRRELVQSLWSGYGQILRYDLEGAPQPTVIVKWINPPSNGAHPRGWNTDIGHQRKLKSYEVEMHWYSQFIINEPCKARIPQYIGSTQVNGADVLVLEDLNAVGYPVRKSNLSIVQMKTCLRWLAQFHAQYMGASTNGLWESGTYWHLQTRPEELEALTDLPLKQKAAAIDNALNCKHESMVHGDAKLANFCFSKDGSQVAVVDFQYVGGGCGMKDVAYFIGSCLVDEDCERHESELLEAYFSVLRSELIANDYHDVEGVITEWSSMFPFAWADFHRFLKGWSPGHWKIHSYSERITQAVIVALDKQVK